MLADYTAVNVATFLVGVGLLLNGYLIVRRGREDVALFVISAVVGAGLIVVAVVPDVFQVVATLLGLELKARAILVVSNLTLFLVAIYLFNRVGRLYERVSLLNEELSLLKNEVEEGRRLGVGERADGGADWRPGAGGHEPPAGAQSSDVDGGGRENAIDGEDEGPRDPGDADG